MTLHQIDYDINMICVLLWIMTILFFDNVVRLRKKMPYTKPSTSNIDIDLVKMILGLCVIHIER